MLLNFVVLLLIILQKPCQNFNVLILWLLSILQAVWKCAYSHELRAESHTSHIGHCCFYSVFKLSIGLLLDAKTVWKLTVMKDTMPTTSNGRINCAMLYSAR